MEKINIISKSRAQKIFVLDDTDLQNLKCIYSKGNNNFKYYIMTDIEKTVINKYGSIENLKKEIIKIDMIFSITILCFFLSYRNIA